MILCTSLSFTPKTDVDWILGNYSAQCLLIWAVYWKQRTFWLSAAYTTLTFQWRESREIERCIPYTRSSMAQWRTKQRTTHSPALNLNPSIFFKKANVLPSQAEEEQRVPDSNTASFEAARNPSWRVCLHGFWVQVIWATPTFGLLSTSSLLG